MLTRKQHELLMLIHGKMLEDGIPPSFEEMKEALSLKSKSGIHRLITALEERGFIRRLPNRARALEVLRLPEGGEALGAGAELEAGGAKSPAGFQPNVIDGGLSGELAGEEGAVVGAAQIPLRPANNVTAFQPRGGGLAARYRQAETEKNAGGKTGPRTGAPLGANVNANAGQGVGQGAQEIPVMGKIAAGVPIAAIENHTRSIAMPVDLTGSGAHFALEVEGDSMIEAGILDGDMVVIRQGDSAEPGDIVVALVDDAEATLKTFRRQGEKIALEAANPAYQTRVLSADRVRVQGRLVGLVRHYQ